MRLPARTTVQLLLYAVLFAGCSASPPPSVSHFRDDYVGLLFAVGQSFGIRTYYVGSDEQWAYFETPLEESLITPTYRKVQTSQMHLPQTFPLGQGKPYRIYMTNFVGYEHAGH